MLVAGDPVQRIAQLQTHEVKTMAELTKFSVTRGIVGKFDMSKATMQEKLEALQAILEQYGDGNAHIVITAKDDASKLSLAPNGCCPN
jgi:hypothetical protein